LTLVPSPIWAFLISTKLPTWESLASSAPWAETGEGADDGACAHVAAFEVGEGADAGAGLHRDAGAEDDVGFYGRVTAHVGVVSEEDGVGRGEGDAVGERLVPAARLEGGLGRGEIGPRVDAHRLGLVAEDDGGGEAFAAGEAHDVGEVEFAGRVVVPDGGAEAEESRRVGHDDAGVAEADGAFLGRRVLELHDAEEAVAVKDQAAVAGGVSGHEAQHHDVVGGAGGLHRLQRLGPDEGRIAVKDDRVAARPFERGGRGEDGVGGALLLLLHGDGDAVVGLVRGVGHGFGPVAHDEDGALGLEHRAGGQRMDEHRRVADLVQDLGAVRQHPRALSCRQHDELGGHCLLFPSARPRSTPWLAARKGRGHHLFFRHIT
jgi:hypothetical protein